MHSLIAISRHIHESLLLSKALIFPPDRTSSAELLCGVIQYFRPYPPFDTVACEWVSIIQCLSLVCFSTPHSLATIGANSHFYLN